jgi:hypothetical protein
MKVFILSTSALLFGKFAVTSVNDLFPKLCYSRHGVAIYTGHASAVWETNQLLPRNLLPCGKRGGGGNKCSNLIGVGRCLDGTQAKSRYPNCYASRTITPTLEECQATAAKLGVRGVEFFDDGDGTQCHLIYDSAVYTAQDFACPENYFKDSRYIDGTGTVKDADAEVNYECYACL